MKSTFSVWILTVIAVGQLLSPAAASVAPSEFSVKDFRPQKKAATGTDRIIVKLRSMQPAFMAREIKADKIHNLSATAGIALAMHRAMSGGAHVLKLPKKMSASDLETYVSALRSHPDVISAEVDRVRRAQLVPNDPYYFGQQVNLQGGSTLFADQWYLKNSVGGINAPAAWDITTGDPNLRIAVLDTGIAPHSDMTGRTIGGYDFITDIPSANDNNGRDSSPVDDGDWISTADITNKTCGLKFDGTPALVAGDEADSSWHGTTVAGIIAAASNTTTPFGIAGIN
ncbi:MAG: S8 family serine peptidase, partial [Burkholderiales bacterium]